jgi:class 3 adenylate cyclase
MEPDEQSADKTLTFLFTDIEDSTGHWQRSPQAMRHALERHDALLRSVLEANGGTVFKTVGDAFCVAFANAPTALAAAITAQQTIAAALSDEASPLPLRVRMALHTGDVQERNADFFGVTVSRVARALGLAHGGQILLTEETYLLARNALPVGASVRDLGEHHLRSFELPCRLRQLCHPDLPDDFPPLKSAAAVPNNLPRSLTPFVGRDRDIAEVRRLLTIAPLVTLTGPGGSGKTRLAVEVGEALRTDFPDGVWFVDLAARNAPHLVREAVRAVVKARPQTSGDSESLSDFLAGKRTLLILDNCEHLIEACAVLADELLQAVDSLRILATSRESLGVGGESLWPVPGLPLPDSRRPLTPRRLLQSEATIKLNSGKF